MTSDSHLSIWFFVGILLTFYGLIIAGAGIYNLVMPPERPWVLYSLHADICVPRLALTVYDSPRRADGHGHFFGLGTC